MAASGETVAATLSSSVTPDLVGRKITPSGKDYSMRITVHGGASAAITVDAAPEALAAGTACTIFQDEYDLVSTLGMFIDGLWTGRGEFVPLKSEDYIRQNYVDPPRQGWPPDAFMRMTKRRIRLSQYPDAVHRIEYPYIQIPADPSGTGDLVIDQNFRHILADGGLYFLHLFKSDKRAEASRAMFEQGIGQAIVYHHRLKVGLSQSGQESTVGPYDGGGYGGSGWRR